MEALNTHTKMGHDAEKVSELMPPAETTPTVEKATEPMSGISSQETPLPGLEPNQVKCPDCGRTLPENVLVPDRSLVVPAHTSVRHTGRAPALRHPSRSVFGRLFLSRCNGCHQHPAGSWRHTKGQLLRLLVDPYFEGHLWSGLPREDRVCR